MIQLKQTPIGKIPKDWEVVRLKNICTKITDGTHRTPKYVEKGIPFISTQNIKPFCKGFDFSQYRKYISLEEHKELTKRCKPEKGDLLISKCGTIGRTKIVDVDYEFSIFVGLALLKLNKKKVCGKFLEQLLNFEPFIRRMEVASPGSTRKTLTISAIKNLLIPLPPLPEQKAIAKILSTVDKAIQKVDEAIAKTERLKKGLMQKLLTKGIGHKEFKYSKELGCEIPREWTVLTLSEMIEKKYILSHMDGNHGELYPRQHEFVDKGIPYINANQLVNGKVDLNKSKYISKEKANQLRKGFAKNGDILFAHNATVGPVGILETKLDYVVLSTTLTYYRCNPEFLFNYYLMYYMQSKHFQNQLRRIMGQSTRNQVPITTQRKLFFIIPDMEEQQKIAEILSTVDKKLELEKKRKEKLERIKKGLMNDLLTGKKRVNVEKVSNEVKNDM
ncbi:MAG TPA: restriction endonuclease subunit S [Thermoplasmatales archaeon]|nr:restriction endonuclease subunit S [Thermoplasmatales archaeon]